MGCAVPTDARNGQTGTASPGGRFRLHRSAPRRHPPGGPGSSPKWSRPGPAAHYVPGMSRRPTPRDLNPAQVLDAVVALGLTAWAVVDTAQHGDSGWLVPAAVAMTLWSGYEFFRDVWRQRHVLSAS